MTFGGAYADFCEQVKWLRIGNKMMKNTFKIVSINVAENLESNQINVISQKLRDVIYGRLQKEKNFKRFLLSQKSIK